MSVEDGYFVHIRRFTMGLGKDILIKTAAALATSEAHPASSVAGFLAYKATEAGIRASVDKAFGDEKEARPQETVPAPQKTQEASTGSVAKTVGKIAVTGAVGLLTLGVIGAIAGKKDS